MPKTKAGLVQRAVAKWVMRALQLQSVHSFSNSGWWWPFGVIRESFAGAWQQNVTLAPTPTLLSFSPVWCCVTGIASDISKIRMILCRTEDEIWEEITESHGNSFESGVISLLNNPNHYQDMVKFLESWTLSKLLYGNTYVLKYSSVRGGPVTSMHILHPRNIHPLVADNGDVYYELHRDDLARTSLADSVEGVDKLTVPARVIIHDRFNTLWHHLVGVSPLFACGTSATLGNSIQTNAQKFFENRSMPGGMLSAPGAISDETALRLKETFEANFGGDNVGRTLVVGDGLDFKPFSIDPEKAQQIEQLEAAGLDAARAFHYPAWKLGGSMPPYTKPDQAQVLYYTDCLQKHFVDIETCLKGGIGLPVHRGIAFDLDELMRMDTEALYESNNKATGWMTPDEQRFRANFRKLRKGGDTVYKQHQDYPIEVIADRTDISGTQPTPPPAPAPPPQPEPNRQTLSPEIIAVLAEYRARSATA